MTDALYRLYDSFAHLIRKEDITLDGVREWYLTYYSHGDPTEIEIFLPFSEEPGLIIRKGDATCKPIGLLSTMDVLLVSAYKMPEDTTVIHNPAYVLPIVKNNKGKPPKGMK